MPRTFFQDFERDDGTPITVEYGVEGSYSPTTYSPMHGASGGDFPEFTILKAWPRSAEYDALAKQWLALLNDGPEARANIETAMAALEFTDKLTAAETERMEAYLAEHYEEEPFDDFA